MVTTRPLSRIKMLLRALQLELELKEEGSSPIRGLRINLLQAAKFSLLQATKFSLLQENKFSPHQDNKFSSSQPKSCINNHSQEESESGMNLGSSSSSYFVFSVKIFSSE